MYASRQSLFELAKRVLVPEAAPLKDQYEEASLRRGETGG
jgi:hypothetical protein